MHAAAGRGEVLEKAIDVVKGLIADTRVESNVK